MLRITIPPGEMYDECKNEFYSLDKPVTITLEHSLVSLSKWESKWKKPFISKSEDRTIEETIDYIKCMTITQNVNEDAYKFLTNENINAVNSYISDTMTATKIYSDKKERNSRKAITSELIYYWMISLNIPFECQKWHLNRLLMLIEVCNAENQPPKKRSNKEVMSEYAAINAARRKKLNTKG